ncbi:3395_t:CDS:2, partial [Entrophospora sp. SA101]
AAKQCFYAIHYTTDTRQVYVELAVRTVPHAKLQQVAGFSKSQPVLVVCFNVQCQQTQTNNEKKFQECGKMHRVMND